MIIIRSTEKFWEFQDFMDKKDLIDTRDWNYWYGIEHDTYLVRFITQRAVELKAYLVLRFE